MSILLEISSDFLDLIGFQMRSMHGTMYVIYCFSCIYCFEFLEGNTILVELLIPLFWISVDVCLQFQNYMVL